MLTNSSSNFIPSSPLICSFNASLYPALFSCISDTKHVNHYLVQTLIYILLILPLYLFIFRVGFQRWKHKGSASGQTSHTDVFTYYMAATEIITICGQMSYWCALGTCTISIMVFGYFYTFIGSAAQTFFHCLSCMERYLAVVHPIIYMRLKQSDGVRIRNGCIVSAWLLNLGSVGIVAMFFPDIPIAFYFSMFALVILIVCFCSISVCWVMIYSGMRRDQTKRRAFQTIVAITATLVLRFLGQAGSLFLLQLEEGTIVSCGDLLMFGAWLCLPSSLVLPLLFLHRNGKQICQKSLN